MRIWVVTGNPRGVGWNGGQGGGCNLGIRDWGGGLNGGQAWFRPRTLTQVDEPGFAEGVASRVVGTWQMATRGDARGKKVDVSLWCRQGAQDRGVQSGTSDLQATAGFGKHTGCRWRFVKMLWKQRHFFGKTQQ